jgi:hypothetical protein
MNYIRVVDASAYPDFNAAFAAAVQLQLDLWIPPGTYRYDRIDWTSTTPVAILARNVVMRPKTSSSTITFGGPVGKQMRGGKLLGLEVDNASIGLIVQNLCHGEVELANLYQCQTGLRLLGNGGSVMYNRFQVTTTQCLTAVSGGATGDGACLNANSFHDCSLGGGKTFISIDPGTVFPEGWWWHNCAFESADVLLSGDHLHWWTFGDCWFEGGTGKPPMELATGNDCSITFRGGRLWGVNLNRGGVTVAA